MADVQPPANINAADPRDHGMILCPLRFEAKHVRAAAGVDRHAIECCGPGESAVERWFSENHQRIRSAAWLLLVGVAGALDSAIPSGTAHVVTTVIDGESGERYPAEMISSPSSASELAITSSNHVIRDRATRVAMFQSTGAQLVDQESAAFARCAMRTHARWGIVRGVSDAVDSVLPRGLEQWVSASGETRLLHVIAALLRSPRDIPRTIQLGRASARAMRAAAATTSQLVKASPAARRHD